MQLNHKMGSGPAKMKLVRPEFGLKQIVGVRHIPIYSNSVVTILEQIIDVGLALIHPQTVRYNRTNSNESDLHA